MPLVKVETLTSYGAFLRRTRATAKARDVLGEAVRTAAELGARRLEIVATEELHLAGGRRFLISARTAEHHLSSVYLALGITGRRQLPQRLAGQ